MSTCTIVRKGANQVDPGGNDVELDENVKAGQYHLCAVSRPTSSHNVDDLERD